MINARHATIITDPELSLLKVSQLERIHFHEQPTTKERKAYSNAGSSTLATTTGGRLAVVLTMSCCGAAIAVALSYLDDGRRYLTAR